MSHWWAGIPAAEVTVVCGGDTHTVRWKAGELIAVDHGDPMSEVTSAGLAGETVPCFELLRTWSRRRDDPHVLTLASRGPTDPLNIDIDGLRFDYGGPRRQTEEQTLGCSPPVAACRTGCRPPPPRSGPGACEPGTPRLGPPGPSLRPLSMDVCSERCVRGSASPS
jgi:hypothetical protein